MTTTVDDAGSIAIDRVTRLRRRLLPPLHRIAQLFGGYALCTTDPAAHVGTVHRDFRRFCRDLRTIGFAPEPIASLKCHGDGRLSAGSWVYRRSLFCDRQLHVTLYRNGRDAVDVYAHDEYSWIRHPYCHYTAEGWDSLEGVRQMRALLSDHGVPIRVD